MPGYKLGKRDWRKNALRVEGGLVSGEWYRSPWFDRDHLLGRTAEHRSEGVAWCGRPLVELALWDDEEWGGLYHTNRKSAHCSECSRREREYDSQ